MYKLTLAMLTMILVSSGLFSIEVGGHIVHSTTWSPENNPYIVTSFLYIDNPATLTIEPGTEIRVVGAEMSDIYNFKWSGNTQPLAKMIIVYGKINAIGTADLPITFDRYQEGNEYKWGSIYMAPTAQVSSFEYCEFRNSFFCDYVPDEWSLAALEFANGSINVRSSIFENNLEALRTIYLQSDVLIYDCSFVATEYSYPAPFGAPGFFGISAAPSPEPASHYKVTIAKCNFTGNAGLGPTGYYMDILYLNNVMDNFISREEQSSDLRSDYGSVCSYGNISYGGSEGWGCKSAEPTDTVFARRNKMIKPINANPENSPLTMSANGFGTNYVSDNYMYGCVQVKTQMTNATTTYIYNNVIENNYPDATLDFGNLNPTNQGGQIRFFNNLLRYFGEIESYAAISHNTSPLIYNNTILNYETLHLSVGSYHAFYTNNIIDVYYSYGYFDEGYSHSLVNNCLIIPIPQSSSIYGENNIVADPMFADTLNVDFSLSAGSPCIDAGAYRPDLPSFDIRYHKRFAPGTADGLRVVDIGASEYNSSYIGGICGYVYDAQTNEPVDCAKIEILSMLPEFSDTLGCFQYPSGAGTYTVKVSRWDYQDLIIPNVTVIEGEDIVLDIPLQLQSVGNDDAVLAHATANFGLRNYPNPFNPETTLSFIVPQSSDINLTIYNVKGQRVKTLHSGHLSQGYHSIIWNGTDDANRLVGSGVYFARIIQNATSDTRKLILCK